MKTEAKIPLEYLIVLILVILFVIAMIALIYSRTDILRNAVI